MKFRGVFLSVVVGFTLLAHAARAVPGQAEILAALNRLTYSLPAAFAGRGLHKAAFLVFATPTDVRSPAETIEKYKVLRSLGVPIDGFYLEAEHTGLSPESARFFVTLAETENFRVMVRPPSLSVDAVKAWNSLGHSGLVVALAEDEATIKAGFAANYYSAGRPIGFERDTVMLTKGKAEDLDAINAQRTLAFMIESFDAVANIKELVKFAEERTKKYGVKKKSVAFWLGPYDLEADVRLKRKDWDEKKQKEWIAENVAKVVKVVTEAGFIMAGHVGDGKTALERIAAGWGAFTIDGMYSENLFSPLSVRQRFGPEAEGFLAAVQQKRNFKKKELTVVRELLELLATHHGCAITFKEGKDAIAAATDGNDD